jgi:hypothetical protein
MTSKPINAHWFLALAAVLAYLGCDLKQQLRYGLDSDHVAEITMWLVIPDVSRHNLAISEELSSFLEDADVLLGQWKRTTALNASLRASPPPRNAGALIAVSSASASFSRVSMHELMDELDWGHFNGFLQFLMTEGKLV